MAISTSTVFDNLYLTAHLPEKVTIITTAQAVEVTISLENTIAFSSVYYPYQNRISVNDIRSIIEAAMLTQGLPAASLSLVATESGVVNPATTSVSDIKVVYSALKYTDGSASFLLTHFLTTRKSAMIPRSGELALNFYTEAFVQGSNTVKVYYRTTRDNVRHTYTYSLGRMLSTTEGIVTMNLSHQHFKEVVEQSNPPFECVVDGVEYNIGNRHFNIFFTDEIPSDTFTFLNAFNIEETVYLFGATTIKTEVDRSEAVCGRTTQFYDETVKVKHEVETSLLTYDEAQWLNQMLTSRQVKRQIDDNGSMATILISDITSEVSSADSEQIRLKFTWVYADGIEYV